MATDGGAKSSSSRFESVPQVNVPTGRNGKHKEIVSQLLHDIAELEAGNALKVPLAELPDTKENIRSALNRATRERGLNIATSSDDDYLYIWTA
jgi:DNA helicase TIP49 (TBP-interacting protein)